MLFRSRFLEKLSVRYFIFHKRYLLLRTRTFDRTLFSVAKIKPPAVLIPTAAPAWLMASTAYSTY